MNNALHLPLAASSLDRPILICFSHLRWDFVLQRPQHLMSRYAKTHRVFFWEEAIPTNHHLPYLEFHAFPGSTVQAIRPRVPDRWSPEEQQRALAGLVDQLLGMPGIGRPVLWLYSPMFWPIVRHVTAAATVYDCMDELSAFRFAPPELTENETQLISAADVVFTGGWSIWEAKRDRHDNIHAFPSAVDTAHFLTARSPSMGQPADQAAIPGPRLGFYGVIDERLDLDLIAALAKAHPDWSIVMIGPVVKVSPDDLPRAPNIHWLGQKSYDELPQYLAGWQVALMPFALNEATRFISPTKTPEFLASGRPVVSTAIRDVVRHYGDLAAVHIAADAAEFIVACETALAQSAGSATGWRDEADAALAGLSWDVTFAKMADLVEAAADERARPAPVDLFPAPGIRRGARRYDVTICGAGFAGSVLARKLAETSGQRVLVVDKRDHIAGNAYDCLDAAGILIHRYGPHIFHTNSDEVVDFLSRFTAWRPYEHRVLADVGGKRVPMPINRTTLNALYGADLQTDEAAAAYLAARAEPVYHITTSRDVVVNVIGRELYETFFQGYTRKQWGLDPSELDKTVTARVPTRCNTDDRYFGDRFQAMPRDGFTRMFEQMLDHPRIDIALSADFHDISAADRGELTIYTGPIDAYFGHRFGPLPYRSLKFRHETLPQRRVQPVAVVNFPSESVPYTRITEYKHLTGQVHPFSSISYEYPSAEGDPYYPIPRPENQELFRRYQDLALEEPNVIFAGRLGSYRYYNMDQVVGQALALHRRLAPRIAQGKLASRAAK